MKFHNNVKKNLFWFIDGIKSERNFSEVRDYVSELKSYTDYRSYFDNVVKSIQPLGPETDREIRSKYSEIRSSLAIVSGLYYGRDLSLKHLEERDYPEEIAALSLNRESLKQQVMTFTHHLLFGREASGVESVGKLQIEQEGLVPMMNRIMVQFEGDDAAQKNELMKHFRVYQLLSEQSLAEAAESAKHDPHLIQLSVALNTLANRSLEVSSATSLASVKAEVVEEDSNSKDSEETRKASFVERYAGNKKPSSKKTVSFSQDV